MSFTQRMMGWTDKQLVLIVDYMQADENYNALIRQQGKLSVEIKKARRVKERLWSKFKSMTDLDKKS